MPDVEAAAEGDCITGLIRLLCFCNPVRALQQVRCGLNGIERGGGSMKGFIRLLVMNSERAAESGDRPSLP